MYNEFVNCRCWESEENTALDTKMMIELVGYLGSALVVISMVMTSVVKLRVVNTVGSAIFMGYALVIGSYPTALMNLFLIGINVYQLFRLFRNQKEYTLVSVNLREGYVSHFIKSNLEDIRIWFPAFSEQSLQADTVYLVCCENQPAGLFIAEKTGPDELNILLDYATPTYRDTSAGRYLYDQLQEKGYKRLLFRNLAPKHVTYMEKVGYRKNERGEYVLELERSNSRS